MNNTPKSLRMHIAIFGRTNVGKSSFLNAIVGQDISITSEIAGTTTDVVEKAMELLPIGPVNFLDTAGIDDETILGRLRIEKTEKVFDRSDLIILLVEPNKWTEYEERIIDQAKSRKIPFFICMTKIDIITPTQDFIAIMAMKTEDILYFSAYDSLNRGEYLEEFRKILIKVMPEEFLKTPSLLGDLVRPGGLVVLMVPIDLQAPKGRLILPQVQAIRDILDNDAITMVVKEREYRHVYSLLNRKPDLIVCDSQVVLKMVADTPEDVKCTTFSILFSRLKGDFRTFVRGAEAIDNLKVGDKILIAEACSHHVLEDDIGRVKIPRWLEQYTGISLKFDVYSGKDYPDNLAEYKLVLHCGACMINRRLMLTRFQKAISLGVEVTNYGMAISKCQGVLRRVIKPFDIF
ncbi:MAG: [FeFe] hydrogenase H-cluster maturation GTPase HydF [bacterium]|nr:[FeFe] hydrogenase H-cluster maturation GTPase HydF [bacterium]